MATRDIDLLWDVRRRLALATTLGRVDRSMLGVLRKVDASLRVRNSQKYTAVNKHGFKRWMSRLPDRDALERRRDALQAQVVEEAVREYLPHLERGHAPDGPWS